MKPFRQLAALIAFNVRTLRGRLGSAGAAVFGIAGVVAVLVGVLSIGEGFRRVMVVAGKPDTAMVLRAGADNEMTSVLLRDDVELIRNAPGVAKDAQGKPLLSPELYVVVDLPKRSSHTDANVPLRGISQGAFAIRPEVKIIEGRTFEWGKNEVIVGRGAHSEFAGTDVGSELHFGTNVWKVVGIFDAKGSISESELWSDAAVLGPAYQRHASNSIVIAKLASPASFQQFKDALTSDPKLSVKVQTETEYYESQSRTLRGLVTGLAFIVCSLMGVGAIFGALNTMYTAVAARAREIATLEALGFGGFAVMMSVIVEALLLAVAGGVLGAGLAYVAFDGYRAATMNWQTFSQVTFAFDVNARLMTWAIVYALFIGLVGGFFPAIRAARMPVANALRER
ncbi:MAG: ABC transporter permease [Acidobacteria bacterium]|nr:ABC transporter permease [Acidobacteriota bacterium]MBV9476673.1 ABC transporter permease [Acidobacteriota bacterium]